MAEKTDYPPTPTLDKRALVSKESRSIGMFLDWLRDDKDILLCRYEEVFDDDKRYPVHPDRDLEHKRVQYSIGIPEAAPIWLDPYTDPDPLYPKWAFIHKDQRPHSESPPKRWYRFKIRDAYLTIGQSFSQLLHEYFEIDEVLAEQETRALLKHIGNMNNPKGEQDDGESEAN